MNNNSNNTDEPIDDSLAYARSLEKAAASESQQEADDPLAGVKDMRLKQLAACRIKTAKELQNKMNKTEDKK
jgi:hypothetical protein